MTRLQPPSTEAQLRDANRRADDAELALVDARALIADLNLQLDRANAAATRIAGRVAPVWRRRAA